MKTVSTTIQARAQKEKTFTRLHAIRIYIRYINSMMFAQTDQVIWWKEELSRARAIESEMVNSINKKIFIHDGEA